MASFDGDSTILTAGGRFVDLLDPRPETIHLDDIAHGLALTCRFVGQCRGFYSVAEHSVRVSRVCDPLDALWGLLHDADEAYLPDLPRPLKGHVPDFSAIKARMTAAVVERFDLARRTLSGTTTEEPLSVIRADGTLLATEGRDLMPPGWAYWNLLYPPLDEEIVPWPRGHAEAMFHRRFHEVASIATRKTVFRAPSDVFWEADKRRREGRE